jgi:hypothetical protein
MSIPTTAAQREFHLAGEDRYENVQDLRYYWIVRIDHNRRIRSKFDPHLSPGAARRGLRDAAAG